MVYLSLQRQNFRSIQMEVDLKTDTEIELESTFSFNVNYNDDDSGCIAELKQTVQQKSNPAEFNIDTDSIESIRRALSAASDDDLKKVAEQYEANKRGR